MKTLFAAMLLAGLASQASGSVAWQAWQDSSFQGVIDEAAAAKKPVVLVVTQPDWCPPCIKINKTWLENPADEVVAKMTAGAVLLEVWGYDQAGADLLRHQDVSFQGTPTVLVFRPTRKGEPLGKARLAGSIVGAPADFPDRLQALLSGTDPVKEARTKAQSAKSGVDAAKAWLEVANLLAARGEADAADEALLKVEAMGGKKATPEVAALAKEAEWTRVASVMLRVRKDPKAALEGIDTYVAAHPPSAGEVADVAYSRAWALAKLGRVEEALALMVQTHVTPGQREGYETFLYFCFRIGTRETLAAGEQRALESLKAFPEKQSALWEGLGRIQRRQGRLAEAHASFEKAVAQAVDDDEKLVVRGQLEQVDREIAAEKKRG